MKWPRFLGEIDHLEGIELMSAPSAMVFDNPPVVFTGGNAALDGNALYRVGDFSDPDGDTWTALVDYGDGSGLKPLPLMLDKSFALDHAYLRAGSYDVKVYVSDSRGGQGVGVFRVSVPPPNNAPPAPQPQPPVGSPTQP